MVFEELVGCVLFSVDPKEKRALFARVSDMQTNQQQPGNELIHREGEQIWWGQRRMPQYGAEVLILEQAKDEAWRLIKAEWDSNRSPQPWEEKSSKMFLANR